jgi:hypothetical protein
MNIVITKGYEGDRIVAFERGATFSQAELRRDQHFIDFKTYTVSTPDYPGEWEPYEVRAINDAAALEFIANKIIAPYEVSERIVTFREVATVEA